MKPDYKNWVPKGMIASFAAGAGVALVLFLIFGVCGAFVGGVLRWFLAGLFGAAALFLVGFTIYCVVWYRAFDYGSFAIHDLFSRGNYGDMDAFIARLKEQGYEQVKLIDTTQGLFMGPREAKWLMLGSSKLLAGRK